MPEPTEVLRNEKWAEIEQVMGLEHRKRLNRLAASRDSGTLFLLWRITELAKRLHAALTNSEPPQAPVAWRIVCADGSHHRALNPVPVDGDWSASESSAKSYCEQWVRILDEGRPEREPVICGPHRPAPLYSEPPEGEEGMLEAVNKALGLLDEALGDTDLDGDDSPTFRAYRVLHEAVFTTPASSDRESGEER